MSSMFWQLNDPSWLRTQYIWYGRTLVDLGAEIGCHESTLRSNLARYGIRKHHDVDEEWLRREFIERGRTQQDLADELLAVDDRDVVVATDQQLGHRAVVPDGDRDGVLRVHVVVRSQSMNGSQPRSGDSRSMVMGVAAMPSNVHPPTR